MTDQDLEKERAGLLKQWEDRSEKPMIVLGFLWLLLRVLEFTTGLNAFLSGLETVIWIVFIIDFLVKLLLAPHKVRYLKSSWLTALALAVPALRIFRMLRAFPALRALRTARAVQGTRMIRMLSSINRGMGALGGSLKRGGFGYAMGLTLIVVLAGAAGMYAFEKDAAPGDFQDFAGALWWTVMLMTTMGSGDWPRTGAGRVLCVLLSIYAFAVFGYVTAVVASYLIGREAQQERGEIAGRKDIESLKQAIEELRSDLRK